MTRFMARWSVDQMFATVATVAVVAGIVAGFWVLGTPGRQRLIAADRQRLEDINAIAQTLHQEFEANPADHPDYQLPTRLDATDNRQDPLTHQPYEYQRLGDRTYQLCANFDTDSRTYRFQPRSPTPNARHWDHPTGRHCFEFEVSTRPQGNDF